jgi:uncharacterized membrane protein YozB (DUF420 family)
MCKGMIFLIRLITGSVFCLISALMYSTYFICRSILGAGKLEIFNDPALEILPKLSLISILLGVIYIIVGEYQIIKKRKA